VAFKREKISGKLGKGVIVSSWVTRGEPPKGVATAEYAEVHQAYTEEAVEALSRQKIPNAKRDYVRGYFDAIRGERTSTTESAPEAPPPKKP
jgi:hypothetical protein